MAELPDPADHLDPQMKQLLNQLEAKRGSKIAMYRAMFNNPPLAEHVSQLGTFLRFQSSLPGNIREATILMTAYLLKAHYEWEKHQEPARQAGLDPKLIKAIGEGGDLSHFQGPYSDLQRLVEIVINLHVIPEELQGRLEKAVGTAGVVELTIIIGFYRMIAGFIAAFQVGSASEVV